VLYTRRVPLLLLTYHQNRYSRLFADPTTSNNMSVVIEKHIIFHLEII